MLFENVLSAPASPSLDPGLERQISNVPASAKELCEYLPGVRMREAVHRLLGCLFLFSLTQVSLKAVTKLLQSVIRVFFFHSSLSLDFFCVCLAPIRK